MGRWPRRAGPDEAAQRHAEESQARVFTACSYSRFAAGSSRPSITLELSRLIRSWVCFELYAVPRRANRSKMFQHIALPSAASKAGPTSNPAQSQRRAAATLMDFAARPHTDRLASNVALGPGLRTTKTVVTTLSQPDPLTTGQIALARLPRLTNDNLALSVVFTCGVAGRHGRQRIHLMQFDGRVRPGRRWRLLARLGGVHSEDDLVKDSLASR